MKNVLMFALVVLLVSIFCNTANAQWSCNDNPATMSAKLRNDTKQLAEYQAWYRANCMKPSAGTKAPADTGSATSEKPAPKPESKAPAPAKPNPAPPAPKAPQKAAPPAGPEAKAPPAPPPAGPKPDPPSAFPPPAPPRPAAPPTSQPTILTKQDLDAMVEAKVKAIVKPDALKDGAPDKPWPTWVWIMIIIGVVLLMKGLDYAHPYIKRLLKNQPIGLHLRVDEVDKKANEALRTANMAAQGVREMVSMVEAATSSPTGATPPPPGPGSGSTT